MNAHSPDRRPLSLAILTVLAAITLLLVGCASSSKQRSNALAEVLVPNKTRDQVVTATLEVFRENGFQLASSGTFQYTFERDASSWDNFAYSGWSGERVIIRIKLQIEPLGDGSHLVTADAFRVVDPADPRMSEEKRVSRAKRGRYQDLLDEIQKRLAAGTVTPKL